MHPYFIVTFAAVIFLLGVVWVIVRENRRQKERHLREFGEQYGRIFDHMYSHEELQRISASSRKMDGKKEGYLDDITWNDLEMDVIFGRGVSISAFAFAEDVIQRVGASRRTDEFFSKP